MPGLGEPIALIGSNGREWISAFWGVVEAGAVVMPLDAQSTDQDLVHMLRISKPRIALVASSLAGRVRTIASSCEVIALERIQLCPHETEVLSHNPWPPGDVLLLFTSGTTGAPKPVPLTDANVLSNVKALLAEEIIQPGDRALIPLPLHHAYPLTVGMLTVLSAGATLVIPSGISGPELVTAMREGRTTVLLGVPRLYEALFAGIVANVSRRSKSTARLFRVALKISVLAKQRLHMPMGRFFFSPLRRQLAPRLRFLVCGGAALATNVEEGLDALGWRVLTGYGLTETSPILCFNRRKMSRMGTVGCALPGVALRIAQPDTDGLGEIQAHGDSVFAGYRNDPAATRSAFTVDGWFRTGDFGRLDSDGYLKVAGRLNETIVLPDGKKVLLETVESAYGGSDLFREIAVLRRESGLVALVVPNLDRIRMAGAARIEELIRETLDAKGRALPSHFRLTGFAISREPLPKTQLGKVRRGQLPALYDRAHARAPSTVRKELSPADAALLEKPVAKFTWQWLRSRYSGRELDLDTSPQLDLGIDSLGWIDFTLALEREVGVRLMEKQIARVVTLRDLLQETLTASDQLQPGEAAAEQRKWLVSLDAASLVLRAIGEYLIRLVMRVAFTLEIEGLEHLPAAGPFVLCPNHASYLDPVAVAAALPKRHLDRTYWAGWTGVLFSTTLRRFFSRLARVLPVDPDRAFSSNIDLSALALEQGKNLVWFPEGARSPDGLLQNFLAGIGVLLERKPVPVIPVLIRGAHEAWPRERRFPDFRHVSVRFGPVVDWQSADGTGRDRPQRIAERIQAAVAELGKPR